MAQTKKARREAYNAKAYKQYQLRVRRGSELYTAMEKTIDTKGASLNYLITKLLAEHYDVPMPEPHLDTP
jgi:hypothetical protein